MNRALFIAVSSTVLLACSSSDPAATPAPSKPPLDAQFSAGPYTVAPGTELTMCSYVRGTNADAQDVIRLHMEQGGHHLIVYTVDHPVDLAPHPCIQGGQPGWTSILITQDPSEDVTFPEAVGLSFLPHQQFVMETHYINTSTVPAEASSSFGVEYAKAGSVKEHAAPFLIGTLNIAIPPAAPWSTEVTCNAPTDLKLLRLFAHEHRRGTGFRVDHIDANAQTETIYETTQWDTPPIKEFPGGFALKASDKLRVSCDWQNPSSQELSFPQEMCFAVGMFWPAPDGALGCNSGGQRPECGCGFSGNFDPGPGGAAVVVRVSRNDSIPGVIGDPKAGKPIYCSLFRDADWTPMGLSPTARPYYQADAEGAELAVSSDSVDIAFSDVTPGDYRALCVMDTINGGPQPGVGDPMSSSPALVKAVAGAPAMANVTLDFGLPGN